MKAAIVYSSVTGNTKAVAEAIGQIMPDGTPICHVQTAPDPGDYDLIIVGFWTIRGGPDPLATEYMRRIHGKKVALFGTLAAWPDSAHALGVKNKAELAINGNHILGTFLCQGKLTDAKLQASLNGTPGGTKHAMTEERRLRLLEASKHPDQQDMKNAQVFFKDLLANLL